MPMNRAVLSHGAAAWVICFNNVFYSLLIASHSIASVLLELYTCPFNGSFFGTAVPKRRGGWMNATDPLGVMV